MDCERCLQSREREFKIENVDLSRCLAAFLRGSGLFLLAHQRSGAEIYLVPSGAMGAIALYSMHKFGLQCLLALTGR